MTNFEKYIKSLTPDSLAQLLDTASYECDMGFCPIYNAKEDGVCDDGDTCHNHLLRWFNQEAKEQ